MQRPEFEPAIHMLEYFAMQGCSIVTQFLKQNHVIQKARALMLYGYLTW